MSNNHCEVLVSTLPAHEVTQVLWFYFMQWY